MPIREEAERIKEPEAMPDTALAKGLSGSSRRPRLSRPSFHWVLESFKAGRRVLKQQEAEPVRLPMLILQAESEYLVSNPHQSQFCQKIPECCHIEKIPGRP